MSQVSAMLFDGGTSHENSSIGEENHIHASVEMTDVEIAEAAAREFLDRLLARDAASWEFLVAEYGPRLRGLGRFYRLTTQDTEGALQSTWFSVLTHASQIRDPMCLGGWLASTMRRACLKALTSARKRPVPVSDWTPYEARWHDDEDTDSTLDAIDHDRQAAQVRDVVAALTPRQRTVIEALFGADEYSYDEVSANTGLPVGAIGPTRQRALRRMRQELGTARSLRVQSSPTGCRPRGCVRCSCGDERHLPAS